MQTTPVVRGMAWMVLTGLLFVSVTGCVRYLGSDMNPAQAAFIRYAFGLALVVPIFVRLLRSRLRPSRPGLLLWRGILHAGGVTLWFYAMARIPVADVTAIGFTAPLFTVIGAALFLGERLRVRRIAAVAIGFVGTLVIIRPGLIEVEIGAVAQLLAAPLFAGSFILAKKLTQTESSAAIVAYLSVCVTLALAPLAIAVWRTPTGEEWLLLFLTAVLATTAHYTMTRAIAAAPITVLQPFSFLQLVWATLLGLLAFGEEPDLWTWIGGGIIVTSATYIAHREALARQRGDG